MQDAAFVDTVREWLRENRLGYSDLSAGEVEALNNFALLWSVFEGYVCAAMYGDERFTANFRQLTCFVDGLEQSLNAVDLENVPRILGALTHFRSRYITNSETNVSFDCLRFAARRDDDYKKICRETLIHTAPDNSAILKTLLFIIYRLRNNLFHGVKWSYQMRGQQQNFEHASKALMAVMDISEGRGHP